MTITGDFTINAGSVLTSNTSGMLKVGGNWNNNGTFNAGTGTVEFNGNSASGIVGSETFYNLIVFGVHPSSKSGMCNLFERCEQAAILNSGETVWIRIKQGQLKTTTSTTF